MFTILRKYIFLVFGVSFLITICCLSLVLVSHAEEYNPQVKGTSIANVRPVVIIDNGERMTAYASGETMEEIFKELGIKCWPEDKIKVFPDPALGIGTKISIRRATPVTILDGLKKIKLRTWSNTVTEVLTEKKIKLNSLDRINFDLKLELTNNIKIVIVRVKEKTTTKVKSIAYQVERRDDPETIKGKEYVSQHGVNGEKEIEYKITYENGREVNREVIGEKIIKEPKTQIVMVGTRPIVTVACGGFDAIAAAAAAKYGVNANNLCRCMWVESQFNPSGIGYGSGGPYYGLFQYQLGSWYYVSSLAGFGGSAWSNATAQIYTTAYSWSQGGCWRWPPCSHICP